MSVPSGRWGDDDARHAELPNAVRIEVSAEVGGRAGVRGKGKGGGARGRDHISTRVIAVAEVSPLIFSARGQGANVLKEDYS